MPVISDRPWLAQLRDIFIKQDASQQPVFDDFNNELVVVYAEDSNSRTRYLSSSERIDIPRSELRRLAIDNLMRVMPKIEMRQHDDAFAMITSHPDYGELLVDDIWSGGQIKVDGDTVVAVPAKDVILVTGSRNRKGLKAVRSIAHELAQGRYGLIDTLFVYRGGKFRVIRLELRLRRAHKSGHFVQNQLSMPTPPHGTRTTWLGSSGSSGDVTL